MKIPNETFKSKIIYEKTWLVTKLVPKHRVVKGIKVRFNQCSMFKHVCNNVHNIAIVFFYEYEKKNEESKIPKLKAKVETFNEFVAEFSWYRDCICILF